MFNLLSCAARHISCPKGYIMSNGHFMPSGISYAARRNSQMKFTGEMTGPAVMKWLRYELSLRDMIYIPLCVMH